ncbi:MAG: hypothetical protein M1575_04015 [Patescibacteria group bacterium]|nr:hypothetical protein [Patescibacteria group bacterium]MCL5095856.1 hypothetical protein [Patescibacteria group bacterium]
MIDNLLSSGYGVSPISPHDRHLKKEGFEIKPQETELHLRLEKSGHHLEFHLNPAEEEIHGAIADLSMPEEQFKEDPKENTKLLERAAWVISAAVKPLFAWGDHELEISRLEPWLRFDRINALAWSNIFSKELVERLGGIKNILLRTSPEMEKEASNMMKELSIIPVSLSILPTEPVSAHITLECEARFPNAILRSFEIISPNAIEKGK